MTAFRSGDLDEPAGEVDAAERGEARNLKCVIADPEKGISSLQAIGQCSPLPALSPPTFVRFSPSY